MLRALLARPAFANWLYGFKPPEAGPVELGHRRVYILPTRLGWTYAAMLGVLLVGSINYALALGFALTFLLTGIGLAGMIHTARNLARATIAAGRADPVFAGESARFHLFVENRARYDRPAILFRHLDSGYSLVADVAPLQAADIVLRAPAARRGWQALGRVMLETRFPLGLFRAWSYVEPDVRCLVYPKPAPSPLPPFSPHDEGGSARAHAPGQDDFSGLRAYQPSDSPRQVAWKAAARTGEMLTKQFSGDSAAELWLDDRLLAAGLPLERRLALLCGWVLAAERAGARYGLRLAGREIAPERGEAHCAACLRALALHDAKP